MTFENDPNRSTEAGPTRPRTGLGRDGARDGSGYGTLWMIAGIAAVVLLGLLIFGAGDRTSTATNTGDKPAPTTTNKAPAGQPTAPGNTTNK